MPGWPERVKTMQRNWIGRSTGTQFSFTVEGMDEQIPVYTTRVDTVYGVTYMVLAPEHPLVPKLIESNPDKASLETFIERMRNENDIVRTAEDAPKEGMFTGSYAIHPLTGERIPIWIANYVLYEYGTGAVMAVPQGDQRDWEFAKSTIFRSSWLSRTRNMTLSWKTWIRHTIQTDSLSIPANSTD